MRFTDSTNIPFCSLRVLRRTVLLNKERVLRFGINDSAGRTNYPVFLGETIKIESEIKSKHKGSNTTVMKFGVKDLYKISTSNKTSHVF